ncbi:hypothetical protein ABZW32_24600 [Streptomyces sp. NPDC004667]|uniref:hypothetical protein n=1 Tax=Streptomyces sp. NPDC004667 TaxID=3154285 RepID=UPI0033ABD8D2
MARTISTVTASALVCGTLMFSAPLAAAAPSGTAPADGGAGVHVRVDQRFALENLVESWMPGRGGPMRVLVLASEPAVAEQEGSVFFLYDPVRSAQTGPIWLSGDTAATSVDHWSDVAFSYPAPGTKRLEVRYGLPGNPLAAPVVASVTGTR